MRLLQAISPGFRSVRRGPALGWATTDLIAKPFFSISEHCMSKG